MASAPKCHVFEIIFGSFHIFKIPIGSNAVFLDSDKKRNFFPGHFDPELKILQFMGTRGSENYIF